MAWWSLACFISALLVLAVPASAINEGLREALYETCDPDARNIIAKIKMEGRPFSQLYHLYISDRARNHHLNTSEDSLRRKEDIQMERIISGCKEIIDNRLENGLDLDINKEDEKGRTFLFETTSYGMVEISKALISAGADVNKTTINGDSVLMIAVYKRRPNITDLLLSSGADISYINRKNKLGYGYGLTILELANEMTLTAYLKKQEGRFNYVPICANVVDVLKKHGASLPEFHSLNQFLESFGINLSEINDPVYRRGKSKITAPPLGFAAWYGRKDVVKMLLEAGADVNAPSESQMKTWSGRRVSKALTLATFRGSAEITKMLLDAGADVNTEDREEKPLERAAKFGYSDVCKILLEAGADINDGALEAAAEYGQTEICQMLLDAGADVNKKHHTIPFHEMSGRTALMAARNLDTAELLLSAGADLNMQDDQGRTALYKAVRRNMDDSSTELSVRNGLEIAKMLIEAGADVNIRVDEISSRGETVLEAAARSGYVEICQMLLEAGAETDNRALGYAAKSGHAETCQMLLNSGVDPNADTLNNAVRSGNKDICQMMLDAGADIDAEALVQAAKNGYTEICQILLDAGADVNARRNDTWERWHGSMQYGKMNTALMVAANMDIAKMLVSAGADPDIQNKDGNTALMMKAGYRGYGDMGDMDIDVAKVLISAGADLDIQDKEGYTAFYRALYWDRTDVARMLIEAGADVSIKPTSKWAAKSMTKKYKELQTEIIKDKLRNGLYLNFNKEDADGVSFLMESVRDGDIELSKLLISAGADVNKIALNGDSALLYAIEFDRPNITDLLLSKGADMNYVNEKIKDKLINGSYLNFNKEDAEGVSFLMESVRDGDVEMTKLLISAGADVNKISLNGDSALLYAIEFDRPNITDLLLSAGADMNYVNQKNMVGYGLTPIEIANYLAMKTRKGRYADVVDVLKKHGAIVPEFQNLTQLLESFGISLAEVNETFKGHNLDSFLEVEILSWSVTPLETVESYFSRVEYLTPLEIAVKYGRTDGVKLLLEAGAETDNEALEYAVENNSTEITQILLDAGANVNAKTPNAVLKTATTLGYGNICKILLEAGADPNDGSLNVALMANKKEICQMLLDAGADVNRKDHYNGETVLMNTHTMDMAELFVSSGADLNIQDDYGNTALCWALWRSNKPIARMLIEAGADVNIRPEQEHWTTPEINRTYAELEQEMNSQG